ncbi:hypothetical protein CK203_076493 [Vitis vinifera]|uniref:Uncharacterized protein n=1 Tax=Vitis vinifera TaxID=29760 RepID=A0A438DB09_VITVI|nr:hypothetical protein CK203_076493 [Vitis vinifera]
MQRLARDHRVSFDLDPYAPHNQFISRDQVRPRGVLPRMSESRRSGGSSEGHSEANPDKVSMRKKQREDLQLRLSAQKKSWRLSLLRREELEADYQKQVDEMYFFGYRCCMKKHGIKGRPFDSPG